MGDKNPKRQKKKKRVVEKQCMAALPVEKKAEDAQIAKQKKPSKGR